MQQLVSSSTHSQASQSADLLWDEESINSDPEVLALLPKQRQAAERLREALCSVPFYAKRAEQARLAGDEMAYWIDLQGSEATLVRPPKASSTTEPT